MPTYSVAETRNRFAEIVHELEQVGRVEVTRRGQRVAVLISVEEYERLCAGRDGFWSAYTAFRDANSAELQGINPGVFAGVRDRSEGRKVEL